MDPRLEQSPPGAPERLTGSASLEGSRRLLRSQPRRLGFGPPRRARPRRSYANITMRVRKPEPKTGTFYLAGNRNFLFGSDTATFRVATEARSTIAEANDLRGELARRHCQASAPGYQLLSFPPRHHRHEPVLPGVRFISVPAPDPHYHVAEWWNDDSSRHLFFSEWSKILGSVLVAYPAYLVAEDSPCCWAVRGYLAAEAHQHLPYLHDPLLFGDRLPSRRPL